MELNRFKELLESKMGSVKPLIQEQGVPSTTQKCMDCFKKNLGLSDVSPQLIQSFKSLKIDPKKIDNYDFSQFENIGGMKVHIEKMKSAYKACYTDCTEAN